MSSCYSFFISYLSYSYINAQLYQQSWELLRTMRRKPDSENPKPESGNSELDNGKQRALLQGMFSPQNEEKYNHGIGKLNMLAASPTLTACTTRLCRSISNRPANFSFDVIWPTPYTTSGTAPRTTSTRPTRPTPAPSLAGGVSRSRMWFSRWDGHEAKRCGAGQQAHPWHGRWRLMRCGA